MYINYPTFTGLYRQAQQEDSLDMYINERGWQDWMSDNTDEVVTLLTTIHEIARSDFSALRKLLNIPQASMIALYCIPRRTLQSWESGERVPPDHVKMLMSYAVIMDSLNEEGEPE